MFNTSGWLQRRDEFADKIDCILEYSISVGRGLLEVDVLVQDALSWL
jgi:hypothetical protein